MEENEERRDTSMVIPVITTLSHISLIGTIWPHTLSLFPSPHFLFPSSNSLSLPLLRELTRREYHNERCKHTGKYEIDEIDLVKRAFGETEREEITL